MYQTIRAKTLSSAAVLATVLGLAGCQSSNDVLAVFAEDAGTAAKAQDDGATLSSSSRTSASVERAYGKSTTLTDSSFSIKKNDDGGVDVTVDGETTSFAATDKNNEFGYAKIDGQIGQEVYSYAGPTSEAFDPDNPNYSQAWLYYLYDDTSEHTGFAVVGTETKPEALQGKVAATYRGYMFATARDNDGSRARTELEAGTDTARTLSPNGGVTMMADFDAGTISGKVNGIVERERGNTGDFGPYQQVAGAIQMNEADITGNGYNGTLTAAGGFPVDLGDSARYSGTFFGPDAQETGGAIAVSADEGNAIGFFRAFEQGPAPTATAK